MSQNIVVVETDLTIARRALTARVAELRVARQQVRDAEALVVIARRAVNRMSQRKTRLVAKIK